MDVGKVRTLFLKYNKKYFVGKKVFLFVDILACITRPYQSYIYKINVCLLPSSVKTHNSLHQMKSKFWFFFSLN